MSTPKTLGSGWFADVTIVDGLIYVAYGTDPAPLVLVVLTLQGVEVRRQTFPGFLDSFPTFGGRWLAYKRNLDWRPVAIDVVSGQEFTFQGQADGNFGLTVNDVLGVVAYQWTAAYQVWLGSLIDGVSHSTQMTGAPDGLASLPALDSIVLRKDIRTSVSGMLNPVKRGDLTVGESFHGGIAVQLDGDVVRIALAGQDTPVPKCATDGTTYALVTGGPQGVRLWPASRADLLALPPASSFQLPAVGKPCLVGWFHFGTAAENAPGNCDLQVDADMLVRRRSDGAVLAQYVAAEADGTIEGLEAAVAAAHVARPTVPVLAYWPRKLQQGRPPRNAEIVGPECYELATETLAAFEQEKRAAIAKCPAAILIAQDYTSNVANTVDVVDLVPVYARLLRDCPPALGILGFSSGTRGTGYDAHPEAVAAWTELAASVTGLPTLPQPAVTPIKPPPPPPPPPPIKTPPVVTPTPVPSPVVHSGDFFMISVFVDPTKKLLAVKSVQPVSNGGTVLENPDGRIVSIQPDGSVQDRDPGADGGYERCKVAGNVATFKPADGKYYTFPFVVVDGL